MLTREFIASPGFERLREAVPAHIRWTREQIHQSLNETLAVRPPGTDVWIFGYGSLIWNPTVEYVERRGASLEGWSRSFGHRLVSGRASPDGEGRMLGLSEGGRTSGIALLLAESTLERELGLLWMREMLSGAYLPQWLLVKLETGAMQQAIVFVSNRKHPNWDDDGSVATVAPLIATAAGPLGTNASYVASLKVALEELGFPDAYVSELARAIEAHSS